MSTITIQDAQARLPELVSTLVPGEEVNIVRDGQVVATLVAPKTDTGPWPCQPGTAKGILTILAEDDDHLADFREYMESGSSSIPMPSSTEDGRPVARLVTIPAAEVARPVPGRCRGMLTILAEDDEHLEDWAEYLP